MRELTMEELVLVSGGRDSTDNGNEVSPVIVEPGSGSDDGGGDDGGNEWGDAGDSGVNGGAGGGGSGSGGGGDNFWRDLLTDIIKSNPMSMPAVLDRNSNTTFNRDLVIGTSYQYVDTLAGPRTVELHFYKDSTFWIDWDKNGQAESHYKLFGDEIWLDANFDGVYETRAGS